MPPHWLHAGPRSRPCRRAGITGGASVKDAAAGMGFVAGAAPLGEDALAAGVLFAPEPELPFPPAAFGSSDDSSGSAGPAVSEAITDWAACWAAWRGRTSRSEERRGGQGG